ncbi:NAD(P)H-binding protein [Spirochaeta cellobiosiphila]|uniref:NmrA family NAD(P)-binding protein n=1 Tax=Spirochaeta cellobiosiphila TaxID=504483 RepID=UPI000405D3C4|nr:NAD(P)H-binding protein [Spirochaeta cellobiosiphila]
MCKIIVCGVDGNFGGYVIDEINTLVDKKDLILTAPLEKGLIEYKNQGYETRVANFNHYEGLEKAFAGGEVLLLISAPFVGKKRQTAHKNAVDGAMAAGVNKIVYTSLVNTSDPGNPSIEKVDHAFTEEYIVSKGIDYIFLRNSQFAEAMITSYLTSGGRMLSCQGEGKMSYISRKDCAIAAAHALIKRDIHKTVFNINGPESLTLKELVARGNKETGLNVCVEDVSEEEVYKAFDAIGVPRTTDGLFQEDSPAPYSSDGMVTFARAIRMGKLDSFTNDFEILTAKKARTVSKMFAHKDDYLVGKRNSFDN